MALLVGWQKLSGLEIFEAYMSEAQKKALPQDAQKGVQQGAASEREATSTSTVGVLEHAAR